MTPRRSILPVFIPHLGCPRDCVFCNQRSIAAPSAPTPEETAGMVRAGLKRLGRGAPPEVAFFGGSFTALDHTVRTAYLEAVRPFLLSGEVSGIRISTRPDCVDEGVLEELGRYGVKTVELGAQSMDDRVLLASGRGHSAADTVRAAGLVRAAGFSLILQMMAGLPGEDADSPMETARGLAALKPDGVRIYPAVVLRGTRLEAMMNEETYVPLTLERAVELSARLLAYFCSEGIPVIRLGLNPTEDLSGGEAIAGAYHPALGELARSRVYLERARALLRGREPSGDVTLYVGYGRVSMMTGQRRANLAALTREFGLRSLRVREAELGLFEVRAEEQNP